MESEVCGGHPLLVILYSGMSLSRIEIQYTSSQLIPTYPNLFFWDIPPFEATKKDASFDQSSRIFWGNPPNIN
jgi:hypothetical protein